MKMNPFWPAPAASASLFGSKPADLHANMTLRGVNNGQDNSKGQSFIGTPNHGGKEKSSQPSVTSDSSAQREQQILIQQALPPVPSSNLLVILLSSLFFLISYYYELVNLISVLMSNRGPLSSSP